MKNTWKHIVERATCISCTVIIVATSNLKPANFIPPSQDGYSDSYMLGWD